MFGGGHGGQVGVGAVMDREGGGIQVGVGAVIGREGGGINAVRMGRRHFPEGR